MGIFAAGFWPVLINTAIVFSIEKRTGGGFQHVIQVIIHPQIFFNKISRSHTQRSCNPLNVILIKNRAGRLATIGALETIGLLKYGMVNHMKHLIHLSGILLLQPREEFLVFLFFILRL